MNKSLINLSKSRYRPSPSISPKPISRPPSSSIFPSMASDGIHHFYTRKIGSYEFNVMAVKPRDKKKPLAVCGVWMGEMGWQLMYWRPRVLSMMTSHADCARVIIGDLGHQCLYDGLYDEYWSLKKLPDGSRKGAFKNKGFEWNLNLAIKNGLKPTYHLPAWMSFDMGIVPIAGMNGAEIRATDYGMRAVSELKEPLFVIFPRRRGISSNRNWPEQYWISLTRMLSEYGTVVCAGRKEDSITEVKRAISTSQICGDPQFELAVTIAALKKCRFAVGTDSGGSHLSLCTRTKLLSIGKIKFPKFIEPAAYTGWLPNEVMNVAKHWL